MISYGFLSTSSARRTTGPARIIRSIAANFYPRPPRGGRHILVVIERRPCDISIHVLREEDDRGTRRRSARRRSISIHVLREEDDSWLSPSSAQRSIFLSTSSARRTTARPTAAVVAGLFLSTSSARRTTAFRSDNKRPPPNFYPRPPRGGRRILPRHDVGGVFISIHVLREEDDISFWAHAAP